MIVDADLRLRQQPGRCDGCLAACCSRSSTCWFAGYCAIIEAGERGLADVLSLEFEPAPHALSSVLTYCDMTTSPDGELVPVEQRLAEIQQRYGPGCVSLRGVTFPGVLVMR